MSIQDALLLASKELEIAQKRELWKTDIAKWALDRVDAWMWSKQREIANALVFNKKVAVKSCHSSGKSFNAGKLIEWWTDTRIDLDAIVVSTAPTYEQVNKIIWEYLRADHGKHDLPGKINMQDEWKDIDGRVLGFGRKPSDTNIHGFHGIHRRDGVLAVLDEACGIPQSIWTGVEAITTGINDRILAIGNPDDPNTEFGRIFATPDNGWHKITISAFDTPNFTKEKFEIPEKYREAILNALISPEWVEDKKKSWGESSARYQSKILGQFPTQGSNTLFDQITLARGIETVIEPHRDDKPRLGVDVARFGDDYTVVYEYHSGRVRIQDQWAKMDTVDTSERVDSMARRLGVSDVRVDGVGVGAGVYDQLARLAQNPDGTTEYRVVGMIGNASSPDLHKWVNARAWWYDTMREKMARGKLDIDFEDRNLKEELEGIQYKFGKSYGAIQIESKDEMLARGVKSPDFADAAMYACADLPIDPEHPLADVPLGEAFQLGLEEMLFGEDLSISPL